MQAPANKLKGSLPTFDSEQPLIFLRFRLVTIAENLEERLLKLSPLQFGVGYLDGAYGRHKRTSCLYILLNKTKKLQLRFLVRDLSFDYFHSSQSS